jgi:2-keto-4-pentenoate hydratase/2-oxohepta-3-ene-1,7-dioic acid hydratase in catechol pathway
MRLISFIEQQQLQIGAVCTDQRIVPLQAAETRRSGRASPHLADMLAFLGGAEAARDAARTAADFALEHEPVLLTSFDNIQLLTPVPRPESIREFMAYEQHVINCARNLRMPRWRARADLWLERRFGRDHTLAKKMNLAWYERPVYYKGNRFSVVGHDMDVRIPSYCKRFDYELEFGIFLSRGGHDIGAGAARGYIGGYAIFNDFSARDIQAREMLGRLGPSKGKDFDTGNSIGPCLVTPDEVGDPYSLTMTARINGDEVSRGTSADMHFSFEDMIAYVSRSETLHPGEFFGGGTCSGALGKGCGLEHGRFLQAGDVVELEVERLGLLRNRIVGAVSAQA